MRRRVTSTSRWASCWWTIAMDQAVSYRSHLAIDDWLYFCRPQHALARQQQQWGGAQYGGEELELSRLLIYYWSFADTDGYGNRRTESTAESASASQWNNGRDDYEADAQTHARCRGTVAEGTYRFWVLRGISLVFRSMIEDRISHSLSIWQSFIRFPTSFLSLLSFFKIFVRFHTRCYSRKGAYFKHQRYYWTSFIQITSSHLEKMSF